MSDNSREQVIKSLTLNYPEPDAAYAVLMNEVK